MKITFSLCSMVCRKYDNSESLSLRAASSSEMPESEGDGVMSHCSFDTQYLLDVMFVEPIVMLLLIVVLLLQLLLPFDLL